MSNAPPILVAEDDRNDIILLRRAFAEAKLPNRLVVVETGQDAIDYLAGNGIYGQRDQYPMPGLMLLDLKMPWMDGFDVLNWLRAQPRFAQLPVIVLTSSNLKSDRDRSRQLGVYDYRVKPHSFRELRRLLEEVCVSLLDSEAAKEAGNDGAGVRTEADGH
jgi:CheY-like chemotaxis protein